MGYNTHVVAQAERQLNICSYQMLLPPASSPAKGVSAIVIFFYFASVSYDPCRCCDLCVATCGRKQVVVNVVKSRYKTKRYI